MVTHNSNHSIYITYGKWSVVFLFSWQMLKEEKTKLQLRKESYFRKNAFKTKLKDLMKYILSLGTKRLTHCPIDTRVSVG